MTARHGRNFTFIFFENLSLGSGPSLGPASRGNFFLPCVGCTKLGWLRILAVARCFGCRKLLWQLAYIDPPQEPFWRFMGGRYRMFGPLCIIIYLLKVFLQVFDFI